MQRAKQISESIELGIILALAGGFMDVYSYIGRDHVFANAQTGRGGKLGNHTEQSQIGYLLECDSGSRHFDMGRDMPVEIGFHGCAGSHGDESDNW